MYVLTKNKSSPGDGAKFELLFAGTQEACRTKLREHAEENLLGFDMADPDSWIEYERNDDGNDTSTIYRISPVELVSSEISTSDTVESLEREIEKLRQENKNLLANVDTWKTKFLAVKNATDIIVNQMAWLYDISETKKRKDEHERLEKERQARNENNRA